MILPLTGCLFALLAVVPETNPHDGPKIDPARIITFEKQDLKVEDFPAVGRILDIGGGGEGVIGQVKGAQVVAIDLYAWGMKRTPPGPLKLVMDATDLKFLDGSFSTVTSFFTLMYMSPEQQQKALAEAYRVLEPGGRMRIWEVDLPVASDPKKDIAVFPFVFRLPGSRVVRTGYGTPFPKDAWNLAHYQRIAEKAGFQVETSDVSARVIRLTLVRK